MITHTDYPTNATSRAYADTCSAIHDAIVLGLLDLVAALRAEKWRLESVLETEAIESI